MLLRKARKVLLLKEEIISLAIISKNEMRRINRAYRCVDEPTDVLSFDYGEVLLCPACIQEKYALRLKREVSQKMRELFVHGLVHIAGFDHKNKRQGIMMQEFEKKILA